MTSLYWGDLGGVWWGSLLLAFPGCGGGEAHRLRGASRGVRPCEGCVSLGGLLPAVVGSPPVVGWGASGHFLSSMLCLGSFKADCCCNEASLTR